MKWPDCWESEKLALHLHSVSSTDIIVMQETELKVYLCFCTHLLVLAGIIFLIAIFVSGLEVHCRHYSVFHNIVSKD